MAKELEQLHVLVDMDGVLVDFMGGWVKAWNKLHPENPVDVMEEWYNFYIEECFKGLASEKELTNIFHAPGFFYDLEPLPNAVEGFKQMAKCGIDLTICTAPTTSKHCWQEKADWVEHYLGKEWLRKLIITKDKTIVNGDYLIDDKPVIDGMFDNDPVWEQIYYDQGYNRPEAVGHNDKFRITWDTWPTLLMYHATK